MHESWDEIIADVHRDIPRLRARFGAPHMIQDRCQMCTDAGFPDVLAHYKPVPKGMSHDGKGKPALCYDHAHGKTPVFILRMKGGTVQTEPNKLEPEPVLKSEPITTPELCGCGRPRIHKGRCAVRRNGQAIEPAKPPQTVRTKTTAKLTMPEVLANLLGMLELHRAEIDKDIEAVQRVTRMVAYVEESGTAAEFFKRHSLTAAL